MHDQPVAVMLHAASGMFIALLGGWVATIRPRSAATLGFAAFAGGFGLTLVVANIPEMIHAVAWPWEAVLRSPLNLVYLGGILVMAVRFPVPVRREERGGVIAAGVVTVLFAATWIIATYLAGLFTTPLWTAFRVIDRFAYSSLVGYTLLLALRFRSAGHGRERELFALAGGALLLYVGLAAGAGYGGYGSSPVRATGLSLVVAGSLAAVIVGIAGIWLAATRGTASRTARNMALFTLGLLLAGLVAAAVELGAGEIGLARILMVGTLAYAILRHQLLGIDVKVRWTISRSTIAAVFIAVFFVASEAAQQFFGETFESGYLGILAAGALVFAIAPLSKLADRLAETAVPATGAPGNDEHEEAYRAAVRLALRSGITRREELELARIADAHRINAVRAHHLRDEVERAEEESA